MPKIQVDKSHYAHGYDTKGRYASYWHQVHEAVELGGSDYLEVGIGSALVSRELLSRGLNVTTVDIDPELGPDLVGSLLELPFRSESFDIALCYQVLEHLPFDWFELALAELARVARTHVVLSLPDRRPYFRLSVQLYPVLHRSLKFSLPYIIPPVHRFDGEHHWEIGKRGTPLRTVLAAFLNSGLHCLRRMRIPEHPYHQLFILAKPWQET